MDQMKKLQVTYSCELSSSAADSEEGEKTWRLLKYEMDRASLIIARIFLYLNRGVPGGSTGIIGSAMVDKSTGPVGRRQDWKKAIQESHT